MPYPTNFSLPPAVRRKIKSAKRRRQWRHVWNSEYARHGDEARAFAGAWATVQKGILNDKTEPTTGSRRPWKPLEVDSQDLAALVAKSAASTTADSQIREASMTDELRFFIPISKIDKERRTVSGYASTETKDLDGEIVSLDAVKKALPGYMAWGNIREMHRLSAVGTAREAHVDGKGLFLTAKIVDENAWQKCLEGVYKGYSIGGRKLAKVGDKITDLELSEISIVDRPSNPDARFTVQKSASQSAEAYLVKPPRAPNASSALRKAAKLVVELTKAAPSEPDPNLNDSNAQTHGEHGDSLCKDHGVANCKVCKRAAKRAKKMAKREFNAKQRRQAASSGAAMPDGSFPIQNAKDLSNAHQAIGRAKDPDAARAHIKSRARALGLPNPFKTEKITKRAAIISHTVPDLGSAEPSFLTLSADSDPGVSLGGEVEFGRGLDSGRFALRKDGTPEAEFDVDFISNYIGKALKVENTDGLSKAIIDVLAKASQPTRAMRFKMAQDNLKKARGARRAAAAAVKAAHGMLKAAYIAKAAAKKPNDNDADDDPMAKAMGELQKAFGELGKVGTFTKAAREQIKKAAGRSGQRGQEAGDGEGGFYEIPPGVKDLSPSALTGAGPGSKGGSGEPPIQSLNSNWAGKIAKSSKDGRIDAAVAELIAENAANAARADALAKLPAGRDGRRPFSFDMTKVVGGGDGARDSRVQQEVLFKGVDMSALASGDENLERVEKGKVAGNYLLNAQFGKSIFDPSFRGGAAGRQ